MRNSVNYKLFKAIVNVSAIFQYLGIIVYRSRRVNKPVKILIAFAIYIRLVFNPKRIEEFAVSACEFSVGIFPKQVDDILVFERLPQSAFDSAVQIEFIANLTRKVGAVKRSCLCGVDYKVKFRKVLESVLFPHIAFLSEF